MYEDIKKTGEKFLDQTGDRKLMGTDEERLAKTLTDRAEPPPKRVVAGEYLLHPKAPLSNKGKEAVDTFKKSTEPLDREIVEQVGKNLSRAA